jgi:N-methylhydantoinase B/oxoprolinase/acetone carboxylase alpha subunit
MSKQINRSAFGLRAFLAFAAAASLGGCTYLTQVREDVQPAAVPAMKAAQTLNPDAGKNRKVVAGLDGRAGANLSTTYAKSFEAAKGGRGASKTFEGISGVEN